MRLPGYVAVHVCTRNENRTLEQQVLVDATSFKMRTSRYFKNVNNRAPQYVPGSKAVVRARNCCTVLYLL